MKVLVTLLLSFALLLPLPLTAASSVEDATVNLYCRSKLGSTLFNMTGTGVFIDAKGVILTNAHVGQNFLLATSSAKAKTTCTVRTGSPARDTYTASLLYLSPEWARGYIDAVDDKGGDTGTGERDFALLYVTGTKNKKGKLPAAFPYLPLASASEIPFLAQGTPLSVAGYPAGKKNFRDVRGKLSYLAASTTLESIRTFERPNADVLVLAPTKAAQPGVSGGPVIRASGDIAGIAATMGDAKKNGLRSLRAITTAHLERMTLRDAGVSFASLYLGNLAERARITEAALPSGIRQALETSLRRVR